MTTVALFGAGGKMGVRLSLNLAKTDFDVRHVEVSDFGKERLKKEVGVEAVTPEAAIGAADVVVGYQQHCAGIKSKGKMSEQPRDTSDQTACNKKCE